MDSQNLYLGISKRQDGAMKHSRENRLLFFKKHKLDNKIIVSAGLVHGNKVVVADQLTNSQIIPECDALITNQTDHLLTITVADCLPIYFYDRDKKVIALAHAGWRGVVSEIVKEVISQFIGHYGSNLNDLEVFIGPHIKSCHFEVKADVASQFKPSYSIVRNGKIYLDLSQVVHDQLTSLGVDNSNIDISEECPYCLSAKYFSYRRDHPQELETMIAYIGLKNQ